MDEEKKSGKKTFKRVIKVISVIISGLVSLVFIFVLLLLDPYIYNQEYRKNSVNDIYDEVLVLSTLETNKTKKITYEIDDARLNELFHRAYLKNKSSFNDLISNFYAEKTNEGYDFVFEAKINLIFNLQSRIMIKTTLDKNSDGYVFNIASMKTGKLGAMWFIKWRNLLPDSFFNKLFSDAGLSIESKLSNNQFIYTYENMLKDYKNNFDLGDEFFETVFNEFEVSYESPLKMETNLLPFIANDTYIDLERGNVYNAHIDDYRNFVSSQLGNKKIAVEHGSMLYRYCMKGYNSLTSEEKVIVNTVDFGTAFDIASYDGLKYQENVTKAAGYTVYHDFDSKNPISMSSGVHEISTYDEEKLTYTLRTSDVIFDSASLSTPFGLVAFTISDIYSQIVDGHIYFIYVIDVNGCETNLVLDYVQNDPSLSTQYKTSFDLSDVYFGSRKASEGLKSELLKAFKKTIETSLHLEWMKYNEESNSLTIDFKSIIESTTYGEYYLDYGIGRVKTSPSTLKQYAGLVISFEKS